MDTFPILIDYKERRSRNDKRPPHGCPKSIPWSLIEPHREQAWTNHSQSLETLASRGGLDPGELYCVLTDRHWKYARDGWGFKFNESVRRLNELLKEIGVDDG